MTDEMQQGDEVPPETGSAGDDTCERCGGSGRSEGGTCPDCGGSGKVIEAIGGG